MVGSVLLQRMQQEGDFDHVDPVFFTTSQIGGEGPRIGRNVCPLKDARSLNALRAMEIKADVILKATRVDGVYDADPEQIPDAKFFAAISYREVLSQNLKVMDSTAISLCMDNGMPILVFNLLVDGNIARAVAGEKIGTLVTT